MQEVVNKINELYSLLEEKIKICDSKLEAARKQRVENEEFSKKLVASSKNLRARERIINKYEDFDLEKANFESQRRNYAKESIELKELKESTDKRINVLKEEQKILDQKKATLAKQVISLKEREAAFDKKKADLKGVINGDAIKELLK